MTLKVQLLLLGLFILQATAKLTSETEVDVDEGQDWDIHNINQAAGLDLLDGDIDHDESVARNTIIDQQYRWPLTIPYYLENSLDMNAKGVILKAFDQYRLKTCIDFKPWTGEDNYISVFKGSGCYSSVGNHHVGKQRLSIGKNCDRLATVEHEFLHALGFWHEQSRSDRDDYVTIVWDRIESGKENNFQIRDDSVSSTLGVPYDYNSVMHYGKTAFNVGSEPTIVTKIPDFSDVIGQRMGFSTIDLAKLNRLYNCTYSSTFVMSCNFEEKNICGMIKGAGDARWEHLRSMSDGPQSDFTVMGQCQGKGYFMHFNSASAGPGERALLESAWLYPKPGVQCLQFFLHNTGADDDVLNIWVREYDGATPSGKMTLIKSITGGAMGSWELHTVDLNVTKKARIVFEGVRGSGSTKGGFSLDDINLSSTRCPHHIWHIRNITRLMAITQPGDKLYSPRFLSPSGYSFQVGVYLNGRSDRKGYMGIYFHLTSGPNDHRLTWPCPWHQATMVLMDQHHDIRQQMNLHRMVTTDPKKMSSDGDELYWDDPRKVGSKVTESDGSYFYRGPGTGTSSFITHARLRSRDFIKGDDAFFLFSLKDISDLQEPQTITDHAHASHMMADDEGAPHGAVGNISVVAVVTLSAVATIFVVSMAILGTRLRRRRQQQIDRTVIIQDLPEFIESETTP